TASIEDFVMLFNETQTIENISSYFEEPNGLPITIELDGNTNPAVLSAEFTDNNLYLTANSVSGETQITIKATANDHFAFLVFTVKVEDPALIDIMYCTFEDNDEGWVTEGAGWEWNLSVGIGGNSTKYFGVDSDAAGSSVHVNSWLWSEPISNIENYNDIAITFDYGIKEYAAENLYFCYMLPESEPVVIEDLAKSDSFVEKSLSLPEPAKVNGVKFGFHYDDNNNWGWYAAVDNFRIRGVDGDNINELLVNNFIVYQNYPNPFNPTTNIKFEIVNDLDISVSVVNTNGETVHVFDNKSFKKGINTLSFDASKLSSGVYFAIFKGENINKTLKMTLLK
ncbi:MAG: T9SS type A sorting domain-containing protein, partial [Candidatus Delongbacteria bacterium]|nr:T9SS type A sorting domain-containing protein [Candidatus Delongbacteria bacterium]